MILLAKGDLKKYEEIRDSHRLLCASRPRNQWTGTLWNALPVPVFRCIFNPHILPALFLL
jgi:hypothetical protein